MLYCFSRAFKTRYAKIFFRQKGKWKGFWFAESARWREERKQEGESNNVGSHTYRLWPRDDVPGHCPPPKLAKPSFSDSAALGTNIVSEYYLTYAHMKGDC